VTYIAEPTDLHPAWAERLNAGDVDGMLALAEPGSAYAPRPGVVVTGDDYRSALEHLLLLRVPIELTLRRHIVVDDLALLLYDWTIDGTDPDGNEVHLSGTTADVARKGPDGWRFVIDNPFGTA